jgi:hypothetical protein
VKTSNGEKRRRRNSPRRNGEDTKREGIFNNLSMISEMLNSACSKCMFPDSTLLVSSIVFNKSTKNKNLRVSKLKEYDKVSIK